MAPPSLTHAATAAAALLALTAADARAGDNPPRPPTVATRPATALGLNALTANGTAHPHGLATTYYFEYGPTTAYGSRTAPLPLPPRLAAHYHESWDEGFGGWASWLKRSHHPTGGAVKGFVRFAQPSAHDHNHDNGIGTLHLVKYIYPGPHPGEVAPSLYLAGGDPDFRDAKVSVWVRGHDFKPNGAELLWWAQSQTNIEALPGPAWRRPNWAHTGVTLTDHLSDGEWHRVDYRLTN